MIAYILNDQIWPISLSFAFGSGLQGQVSRSFGLFGNMAFVQYKRKINQLICKTWPNWQDTAKVLSRL